MFEYTISKEADNAAFKKACAAVEIAHKDFKKDKLLVDVDGTLIQTYTTPQQKIKIVNDYFIDAVYVKSTVNLDNVLQ